MPDVAASEESPTDTVTVVAVVRAMLSFAVTVIFSFSLSSATFVGLRDRVMAWVSSSASVSVVPVTVEDALVPATPIVSLPSTAVSWVGVSVNVPVPVVAFALSVSVKSATVA